ncbi:MAG TPA: class I SAM-dependent methyltransferase [Usitatibacter sp.]|nr:class I SAM-dependent methyltransferase [Usitatibacter sp.]
MHKDDFDVALIPGMRERLAQAYARFRAAQDAFQEGESRIASAASTRVRCPGCDAPAGEAEPLFVARSLRHVRCRRCALVFTLDVLAGEADRALYQPNTAMAAYLALKEGPDYARLERDKARYLASLAARFGARGAFLDIGCSTGALMAAAREEGFEPYGLDANPDMVERARARFGGRAATGYFPDALPSDWPRFGAIAILDLLEHMVEPKVFLGQLAERLDPAGLLLVQVPNFDSLIVQLEGPANTNFCHGHWTHFTAATLAPLARSAGFTELAHETIISELDRIRAFPRERIAAALARLAPAYRGGVEGLDAAELHRMLLGYKLVAVFRKGPPGPAAPILSR